jgi:hypothetical protein
MEVSGRLHALAALPPGTQPPSTHCIGGWMGPTTGLDIMQKRKSLAFAVNQTLILHSASLCPSCYTD